MKSEHLKQVSEAIDDLVAHPPETPLERLRAALMIVQAREVLDDAAGQAELTRQRTTLPSDDYLVRRDGSEWLTYFKGAVVAASHHKPSAYRDAWEHFDDPEQFVLPQPTRSGRKKP